MKKDSEGEFIEVQHPEYGTGKAYIQEGLLGGPGHVSTSFSKPGLAGKIIQQEHDLNGFKFSDSIDVKENGRKEIHVYTRHIEKGGWDKDKFNEAKKTWDGKRFSAAPFNPGLTYEVKIKENNDGTVSVTAYNPEGGPGSVSINTIGLIALYMGKNTDMEHEKDRISKQMTG